MPTKSVRKKIPAKSPKKSPKKPSGLDFSRPNVIGIIHDAAGFEDPAGDGVDAMEVRVDALPYPPLPEELAVLGKPLIITVRDPQEGGALPLPPEIRRDLYLELLPVAAALDIEAANLRGLHVVVDQATKLGRPVIASIHDFEGVPTKRNLLTKAAKARDLGATCVKIAALVNTSGDLARLLDLYEALGNPTSAMGMGPLGRVSRLVFARCGSCLNYAWLGNPQVPGQWSAAEMLAWMPSIWE